MNHFHDDFFMLFCPQLYLLQIYMFTRLTAHHNTSLRIASFGWWLSMSFWTEYCSGSVKCVLQTPWKSATCSHCIRGYITVKDTLKFTYYLNERNYVLLKIIGVLSFIGGVFISYNRYLIKKLYPQFDLQSKHVMASYVSYWYIYKKI
jgi:hypothetical protein